MNKRLSESSILKLIVLLPIIAIILTAIILTNIFINTEKKSFDEELNIIKEQHISNIKIRIKNRVNRIIEVIKVQDTISFENRHKQLKDIVYMGHNAIDSLNSEYKDMNKEARLEEIKHHLRKMRFFKNKSGYFYIFDMNGNNILHPVLPKLESTNLLNQKDIKGKELVKVAIENLKNKDESFDTWYWNKDGVETKKLVFYKIYKPLNIYIGTGIYFDDIYEKNLNDSLKLLNSIIYEDNNYPFAVNNDGVTVAHYNKKFINLPLEKMSPKGQKVIKGILKKRDLKEGSFIEYSTMSIDDSKKRTYKISFVKYVPKLKLTIGTGFHTHQLEDTLKVKAEQLTNKLNSTINKIVISSIIVTLVLVLLMLLVTNSLKNILNNYAKELSKKNKDLEELNQNLEKKVALQVEKSRKKDELLNQQSKMAAMGEMLSNISHQWRQPLSAISSSASGIKFQDDLEILEKKDLHKGLEFIIRNTKLLSQTIDDFRDFFNPHKKLSQFDIKQCFQKVFTLLSANLKNKNIHIIQDIPSIKINTLQNELVQSLLNIINNSKDAMIHLDKNEKRYIFIDVIEEEKYIQINIKDNANGITQEIISRIFEPYFTTKHQTHGTGIGLYMTKKIVETNLHGEISIVNETYEYEGVQYTGALCSIRLPKKL